MFRAPEPDAASIRLLSPFPWALKMNGKTSTPVIS